VMYSTPDGMRQRTSAARSNDLRKTYRAHSSPAPAW
jgi:hypothetical protein